jgi:hypothetical protein
MSNKKPARVRSGRFLNPGGPGEQEIATEYLGRPGQDEGLHMRPDFIQAFIPDAESMIASQCQAFSKHTFPGKWTEMNCRYLCFGRGLFYGQRQVQRRSVGRVQLPDLPVHAEGADILVPNDGNFHVGDSLYENQYFQSGPFSGEAEVNPELLGSSLKPWIADQQAGSASQARLISKVDFAWFIPCINAWTAYVQAL